MFEEISSSNKRQDIRSSFRQGWALFKSSIAFILEKPIFVIPIFLCWVISAAVVLYLRYWWVSPKASGLVLLEIFTFILVLAYSTCLSNLMLLELIKQIEDDDSISFGKAFAATISGDSLKVIPLAVFFAIVWFIILILQGVTDKFRGDRSEPSPRDAAQTLAGIPGGLSANPFSWLRLGLDMFEKLLRMTVFLALPAIAWEHEGSYAAFKKAVTIVKKHPTQFFSEYGLTLSAAFVMAIPLVPIYIVDKVGGTFPNSVWYAVIFYEGIIWTLGIYLEQMSMALLYLWQINWEKDGKTPDLATFEKPDLLQALHALGQMTWEQKRS
jgi:hypothetical protein